MSSRSMTPKENTSDLSVSLPLDAYSGARYLHAREQPASHPVRALCRNLRVTELSICSTLLTRKFP